MMKVSASLILLLSILAKSDAGSNYKDSLMFWRGIEEQNLHRQNAEPSVVPSWKGDLQYKTTASKQNVSAKVPSSPPPMNRKGDSLPSNQEQQMQRTLANLKNLYYGQFDEEDQFENVEDWSTDVQVPHSVSEMYQLGEDYEEERNEYEDEERNGYEDEERNGYEDEERNGYEDEERSSGFEDEEENDRYGYDGSSGSEDREEHDRYDERGYWNEYGPVGTSPSQKYQVPHALYYLPHAAYEADQWNER
jgi:hypothetical protein